jgi:hypothetical protein
MINFDGQSANDNRRVFGFAFVPPDTNGAVGASQYVQMVNVTLAVTASATGYCNSGPWSADPRRRQQRAMQFVQTLGRLQQHDRRSQGRLHVVVHAGVLRFHRQLQLGDSYRIVQIRQLKPGGR